MNPITITLPDGTKKQFEAGVTGLAIASSISKGLAREALAVEVNGQVWDLSRPITSDSTVRILKWADDGGKYAYWHSSAHLMAEALEALFPGTKFGIGPPVEGGFYYDIDVGEHRLTAEDLDRVEKKMVELAERDAAYVREEKSWDDAVAYFRAKGDEYKLELLQDLKGERFTFYHQGSFTDLCYSSSLAAISRNLASDSCPWPSNALAWVSSSRGSLSGA